MYHHQNQPPNLHETGDPFLDDLAVALAAAIAAAEVDAVAAVLADPQQLVDVAESEGVTPATFQQEDARLIWCAADVARAHPVITVLRLARAALRDARHWDTAGPFGTGSRWSDETLAALAERFPASVAATRYAARHLVALRRRWQQAERLLGDLRDALDFTERSLSGGLAPHDPVPEPLVIHNAPLRRKRGAA